MDNDQTISRNRSDDDLISDLPLQIIHSILTLLPIRDAVRTCILSSKWRYKWCSLPRLRFDIHSADSSGDCLQEDFTREELTKSVDRRNERLKRNVTHSLFHHQGPIQRFELWDCYLKSCPDTDSWLLCLSRNGIEELFLANFWHCALTKGNHGQTIMFRSGAVSRSDEDIDRWFRVHSSLYSCQNLTYLELSRCELPPPPPTFKGFPFLRTLVLSLVRAPCALVESLVQNSPLLENLECRRSAGPELRIRAPNLKSFQLSGEDFKEIIVDAPLLTELLVTYFTFLAEQQQSSVCNYAKFLGGCTNLERLDVSSVHFLKYLSFGIESDDHSLVFDRLKSIKLSNLSFDDRKQVATVVGHLIMAAPNLHKFIFSMEKPPDASEAPPMDLSYSDFRWAPDFTINKLREVVVDGFLGRPSEMEFLKLLLKSATVLETMTVECYPHRGLDPDRIPNLTTELLSCCRASPNAKVLVNQWRRVIDQAPFHPKH